MSDRDLGPLEREFAEYASIARVKSAAEGIMVNPVEIGAGLRSFTELTKILGRLRELGKKAENAEFMNLFADLSMEVARANLELARVTKQLAEQTQENNDLKEKIQNLENLLKPENRLEEGENGLYYKSGSDKPFCPTCYMNGKKTPLSNYPGFILKCSDPGCQFVRS